MGRTDRALILLALVFLLSACGQRDLPADEPSLGVGRAVPTEADPTPPPDRSFYGMPVSEEPAYTALGDSAGEDIDLTELNAARLYARVGTMNGNPGEYAGESIRLAGVFSSEETADGRRYYISVPDAAGCCLESFELRPGEAADYPADFPDEGAVATVTGIFNFVQVNEYLHYSFIEDARILWEKSGS